MTAIGPYTKSYDNTHMYSFVDYRKSREAPKMCASKNTLMDYLIRNPKTSKFRKIVERAGLTGQMSAQDLDITLFIPSDDYLNEPGEFYDNMDRGLASQIIAVSSLNNRISGCLIRSSPVSSFTVRDPYNADQMYITNISNVTEINQCARVVEFDVELDNALVHLTDGLLLPNLSTFIY